MRREIIFLIIVIINAIIAIAYLLISLFIVLPISKKKYKDEWEEKQRNKPVSIDEKKEEYVFLRDGAATYVMRFIIMLLCPVAGIVFFGVGHVLYAIFFHKKVSLDDVVFSKERVKTYIMADEERERNLVPLEEGIAISNKRDLRGLMMNVVKEDVSESLAAITMALNSSDSETSHYAAAVLVDELNDFRANVQKIMGAIHEEGPEQTDYEILLVGYMNQILRQRVFSDMEQSKFALIMSEAMQILYEKDKTKIEVEMYEGMCLRLLEVREFELMSEWCNKLTAAFPEELAAYTTKLKMYFTTKEKERFLATLKDLRNSKVTVDQETLELIRVFS